MPVAREKSFHPGRRQQGMSLLEVLIAIVILSFGLLGLAGLQLTSLKNNHGASLRSQANILGYDVVDRMRANRNAALAGDYVIGADATPSRTGITQDDLTEWKALLAGALPAGKGKIEMDIPTHTVTVTIQWDESRSVRTGDSDIKQFVVETQL